MAGSQSFLDSFLEFLSQEPLGSHEQDQDDHEKCEGVLERDGYVSSGQRFRDSQNDTSYDSARRLFRPPRIAAANPLRNGSSMKKGSRISAGARNRPARTPRKEALPHERARI